MERSYVTNLRADVQAYAGHPQIFVLGGPAVKLAGVADWDPELVLTQAGGNIRMRFSRHVRIYAQGNVGYFAEFRSAGGQKLKLAFTFHVEEQDSAAQSQAQLIRGFAHAGKHYFAERLFMRSAN